MSFEALRWVRDLRAKPLQKLVLWALGDCASATGEAWPSIAALRAWTGLSERAVQRTLRELVEGGVLVLVAGGGRRRTSRYRLLIGTALKTPSAVRGKRAATPAVGRGLEAATPANVRGLRGETPPATQGFVPETPSLMLPLPGGTPSAVRGIGAETPHHRHPEPPESNPGKGVSGGEGGTRAAARAARGGRLPPDWQPDVDDRAFAVALGLDVDWVAGQFVDYWRSRAGAGGVRLDWHATWRNWCRKEAEEGRGHRVGAGGRGRGASGPRQGGNDLDYLRESIFGRDPEQDEGPRGPIIDMAVGE